MIEGREHLRLALETGETIGVGRENVRKDFHRDVPLQLRVAGFVDLTHPARPDGGQDLINAQTGARSEAHENAGSLSHPGRRGFPRHSAEEIGERFRPTADSDGRPRLRTAD